MPTTMAHLLLGALASAALSDANMNGEYLLGNNAGGKAGSSFARLSNMSHYDSSGTPVEYFDVYSPPIRSRYGQTFWTMMDAVPLPREIVERFDGRVMAITGYESDQVFEPVPGKPDVSVPITWAYNHHFEHHLTGKHGSMVNKQPAAGEHVSSHRMPDGSVWAGEAKADDPDPDSPIPVATIFSEGNGGEFRKSFHGYGAPFAQLIDSPVSWSMMPMQIDTKNREAGKMEKPGDPFVPGEYPRTAHHGKGVPAPTSGPDAVYSGLLECPCTDRISVTADGKAAFGDTKGQKVTYTHGGEVGNQTGIVAQQTQAFYKNCGIKTALGTPMGELLSRRNPTCDARAYVGGLSCCTHHWFLLDKNQTSPPEVLEYRLKARFYFQGASRRKSMSVSIHLSPPFRFQLWTSSDEAAGWLAGWQSTTRPGTRTSGAGALRPTPARASTTSSSARRARRPSSASTRSPPTCRSRTLRPAPPTRAGRAASATSGTFGTG
jgi:hypothetical protein